MQVKGGLCKEGVRRGGVTKCRRYSPGTKGLHSYNVSYDSGGSTTDDDLLAEGKGVFNECATDDDDGLRP